MLDQAGVITGAGATPAGVDVRHASELSYAEFVQRYMAPNVPVIIKASTRADQVSCCCECAGAPAETSPNAKIGRQPPQSASIHMMC